MYICKMCGQHNGDEERFCIKCGEYIGEPLKQKEIFSIKDMAPKEGKSGVLVRNDKEKSLSGKIVDNFFKYMNNLIKLCKNPINSLVEDMSLKSISIIFIFAGLMDSLLLVLLQKYVFYSSSNLIKHFIMITPVKWNEDALSTINLTGFYILLHGMIMFAAGTVLLFCSVYLIMYYIFKKDIALQLLFKVEAISSLWLTLALFGILAFSILGLQFSAIIFFILIVQYFLVFTHGISILSGIKADKAGYVSSLSHIILLAGIYTYIMIFIK